jgi:hypothetical protein
MDQFNVGYRLAVSVLRVVAVLLALGLVEASAEVKQIVVTSREPWLNGRVMGKAGAYEKLQGRVIYAIDPKSAANQGIADVALAPRNADGLVEFAGDFVVVRPVDPAKARTSVLLEVLNRGMTQANHSFFATAPDTPFNVDKLEGVKLQDAMVFEQGFTVAWVGWQFDLPKGQVQLQVPVAPVKSVVRDAILLDATDAEGHVQALGGANSYCAADTVEDSATLTVKTRFDDPGKVLPRGSWSFAREEDGKAIPDACSVLLPEGFKRYQLYEVTYTGAPPAVAGLGLAALRDFVSYLKYGGVASALRERPETEQRVLGFGYSQSARLLRQYLYDGFTADERGRKTFDGLFIASAGAGRGSFNHRYAMPGEAGNSVLSDLRPADLFPFTDGDEVDPLTHRQDALLAKAHASKTLPKIIYTYSSTEYWARVGSLATTTVDGTRDLPLDASSRLYFFPGTPHSHAPFPPIKVNQRTKERFENYANFSSAGWSFRALLLELDAWTATGEEPPASVYPSLAKKQLVPLNQVRFPAVTGFALPASMPKNWRMDYGKDFQTTGVITNEPPKLGPAYTVLVPQVDADGNDVGGIASPFLAVPLGTYTGWNYVLPRMASFDFLGGLFGSFEPFAQTKAARQAAGDARASIEERYKGREDYLEQVHAATIKLVQQRFFRMEDVAAIENEMAAYWDGLSAMQQSAVGK